MIRIIKNLNVFILTLRHESIDYQVLKRQTKKLMQEQSSSPEVSLQTPQLSSKLAGFQQPRELLPTGLSGNNQAYREANRGEQNNHSEADSQNMPSGNQGQHIADYFFKVVNNILSQETLSTPTRRIIGKICAGLSKWKKLTKTKLQPFLGDIKQFKMKNFSKKAVKNQEASMVKDACYELQLAVYDHFQDVDWAVNEAMEICSSPRWKDSIYYKIYEESVRGHIEYFRIHRFLKKRLNKSSRIQARKPQIKRQDEEEQSFQGHQADPWSEFHIQSPGYFPEVNQNNCQQVSRRFSHKQSSQHSLQQQIDRYVDL